MSLVRNSKFRVFKIRFSVKAHPPNLVVYRKTVPFAVIVMHVPMSQLTVGIHKRYVIKICEFQSHRFVHNTNNKYQVLLHSKILPILKLSEKCVILIVE